ncbi:MAG: hypothetical protein ACTHOM_01530 [Allomuricauda sp.]
MNAKDIFEKLEKKVAEGELEKSSSGGDIEIGYYGRDNNGNEIKTSVKRYDIDYLKNGEVIYNVYYCKSIDGRFEDVNVDDKLNLMFYTQIISDY